MRHRTYSLPRLIAWVAIAVLALYVFPPFHVRHIGRRGVKTDANLADADVAMIATEFWNNRLAVSAVPPTEARVLLDALNRDPAAAGHLYGRRPGIGGPLFYFVSGEARVESTDHTGVWLDPGVPGPIRIVLQTGPIFGSALRDATGLLNLDDFSSFQFNELGAQLNRLAETHGEPPLRNGAKVGSVVQFLAAGQLRQTPGDVPTLKLVPIRVRLK